MRHRKAMLPGSMRGLSWALACLCLSTFPCSAVASSEILRTFPPGDVLRFQPRTAEEATQLPVDPLRRGLRDAFAPERASLPAAAASNALVGDWTEWGPPVRTRHRMMFDPRRNELLVVGGDRGEDPQSALWAFSFADGRWRQRSTMPAPDGLYMTTIGAAIDAAGDRLIVARFVLPMGATAYRIELLIGSLAPGSSWQVIDVPESRAGLDHVGLAIDPLRQQALLPGLWSPSLGRYEMLRVPLDAPETCAFEPMLGAAPPAAQSGTSVFDESRDALVVQLSSGPNPSWWRVPAVGSPDWQPFAMPLLPLCGRPETLVRDAAADGLIIGDDEGAVVAVPASGGAGVSLVNECFTRRTGAALAMDPITRTLWRHGGRDLLDAYPLMQSLDLDAPTGWKEGTPDHLGSRIWHSSVVDRESQRLIVFGGWVAGPIRALAMARSLDGEGGWTTVGVQGSVQPRVRFLQSLVLDPVRRQLLLFGGQATDGSGDMLDDLWRLPLTPGGQWERIAIPGPGARRLCSMWYDAANDRFIVAGGDDLVKPLAEVWELRLTPTPTWRQLGTRGDLGPPQRMVLPDPVRGDAWVLGLGVAIHHLTFTADSVIGERFEMAPEDLIDVAPVAFDAARREIVAFGITPGYRMDLGQPLSMPVGTALRWQPRALASAPVDPRVLSAFASDPAADRLFLVGGYDDDSRYFADTWVLQWQAPVATTVSLALAEADARRTRLEWRVSGDAGEVGVVERSADGVAWQERGAAFALAADRLAYEDAPLAPGERAAYRLRFGALAAQSVSEPVWIERPAAPARLALAPTQNPSFGALRVRLALTGDAPATLALFDATGRLLEQAAVTARQREFTFVTSPTPGLYLARLSQGGEHTMVKLAASR